MRKIPKDLVDRLQNPDKYKIPTIILSPSVAEISTVPAYNQAYDNMYRAVLEGIDAYNTLHTTTFPFISPNRNNYTTISVDMQSLRSNLSHW